MLEQELQLTMVSNKEKFDFDVFSSELIVAVVSFNNEKSEYNNKTELLDVDGNNWIKADDYPFDWGLTYFLFL